MEEILEGSVRAVGRGLRYLFWGMWVREGLLRAMGEVLRFLLWGVAVQLVLFNLGRGFLLLTTLGRFPRGSAGERHEGLIATTGLLLVLGTWTAIALYNHLA